MRITTLFNNNNLHLFAKTSTCELKNHLITKKNILVFALFVVNFSTFGQFNIGVVNESLVKIDKKLYASRSEVTNGMYMTFISSLKQSQRKDLLAIAEVDSAKFQSIVPTKLYHSHQGFAKCPVVCIKHEAAIIFCNWLTENYNTNHRRKFKKVIFRLPTEKEWMNAAQAGDTLAIYPWNGDKLRNEYGCYRCRYHVIKVLPPNNKYFYIQYRPMQVGSFEPNKYGMYDMSGNVAEMISEKGITKGGSWKSDSTFLEIKSRDYFDGKNHESIGFRYFAEIIEK